MDTFNSIIDMFVELIDWVLNLLPKSPFTSVIDAISDIPYLSTLNWFIPISTFVALGQIWLTAVGIYYLYSILLRWIKAIK